MRAREFTCPYCQAELEVEFGVERVICPDCENEFAVPPAPQVAFHHRPERPVRSAIVTPVFIIISFILGAGIAAVVWVVYQDHSAIAPVKEPVKPVTVEQPGDTAGAAELARMERDWNALRNRCQLVLAERGNVDPVLAAVERFSQDAPLAYQNQLAAVKDALRRARAEVIAARLKTAREEAKRLAAAGDLTDAARFCRSYTGEYADDVNKTLFDLARRYEASARERQKGCDIVVGIAARNIINEQPARALAELADFEYPEMLVEAMRALRGLDTAKAEIMAGFKQQIGVIGPVKLDGKEVTVRIGDVGDDTVELQRKVGTAIAKKSVSLDEFDLSELAGRLVEADIGAKALYLGCVALKKNDRAAARAWFEKVPQLGPVLISEVDHLPDLPPDPVFTVDPIVAVPSGGSPSVVDPPAAVTIDPRSVVLKGLVRRQTRKDGDYYSSKTQSLVARVSVKNNSTDPLPGLKTELFIIGQSMRKKDIVKVLKRIDAPLDVGKWTSAETADTEISVQFHDSYYSEYGYTYYGWVAALRDARGNLITTSFYRSRLGGIVPQIIEMNENDCCDLSGEKIPPELVPY
ncbi:MAG: hypothetical protein RRC34_04375 [Lentisphaeria bacterium]|nr:hypothetical protein [Lentisphaeria bacterium]